MIHKHMSHWTRPVVLAAFLVGGVLANPQSLPVAQASVFTVTKSGDTNDGVCDADCSLREAVIAANAAAGADTIIIPSGTYTLTIAGPDDDAGATGDLDIAGDLTILGAGAAMTVVDGGGLDAVFHVVFRIPFYTVTISGITIRNGISTSFSQAGGVVNRGNLTVNDSVITSNAGTGISSVEGPVTINNTVIMSNTRPSGVGGLHSNLGFLTVRNSTIRNNSGGWGGVSTDNGFYMINSTVSGNAGTNGPGGMYIVGGGQIINSTISGNTGTEGGGIWTNQGLGLINSTIVSNTVTGTGANIFQTGNGGGIYFFNQSGVVSTTNTLIANNQSSAGSPDCAGAVTSQGYNLIGSTAGCAFAATTGDKLNVSAGVGLLENNGGPTLTHALLPGSPAINGGGATNCPATDQRGVRRAQGGICDIGAFEFEEPTWFVFLPAIRK